MITASVIRSCVSLRYQFINCANRGVLLKPLILKNPFEFATPTKGTESVLPYTVSCFLTVRYFSWFCKFQFLLISAIVFSVTISNQLLRMGKFLSQFGKERRYRAKLLLFSKKCWQYFHFCAPQAKTKVLSALSSYSNFQWFTIPALYITNHKHVPQRCFTQFILMHL